MDATSNHHEARRQENNNCSHLSCIIPILDGLIATRRPLFGASITTTTTTTTQPPSRTVIMQTGSGHYWLSKLRETNPDPQMASLPPLPPNNAVKLTSNASSSVPSSPLAAASNTTGSSSSYWLGRLNEAENWAKGGSTNSFALHDQQ